MTIEDLSARLERVERQHRRMRAGGALGLLLMLAIAGMGQIVKPRDEVRGGSFVAIEPGGKTCISMMAGPYPGAGLLSFLDREGKARCSLDTMGAETELEFREKGGDVQVRVAVENDGAAGLRLSDSNGRLRAVLCVAATGNPELTFFDKDGKLLERLPR